MGARSLSTRAGRLAAVAGIFLLTRVTPARAQVAAAARTSSLAWVRSEGADACIGNKELAEAVERILGRRVFVSASAADVALEGQVGRAAGGWKATLRISDEHGTLLGSRELASPAADCRAMDGSIAFVIAVMIDPDAAARPPTPLAPSPPPSSATDGPSRPPPAAPPHARWAIAPEVGLVAAFGELPSPAVGVTLAARFGPPSIAMAAFGAYFLSQSATVPRIAGASGHFGWAYAGLALCPTLARVATAVFVACAGAAGGVVSATPRGLADEQGTTDFDVFAVLRARVEWRFTRAVFAVAEGGVDLPFRRPAWSANAAGTVIPVFRPSAVAGEAAISVGVTID